MAGPQEKTGLTIAEARHLIKVAPGQAAVATKCTQLVTDTGNGVRASTKLIIQFKVPIGQAIHMIDIGDDFDGLGPDRVGLLYDIEECLLHIRKQCGDILKQTDNALAPSLVLRIALTMICLWKLLRPMDKKHKDARDVVIQDFDKIHAEAIGLYEKIRGMMFGDAILKMPFDPKNADAVRRRIQELKKLSTREYDESPKYS